MPPKKSQGRGGRSTRDAVVKRPSMQDRGQKARGDKVADQRKREEERGDVLRPEDPASSSATSTDRMGRGTSASIGTQTGPVMRTVKVVKVELVCMSKNNQRASSFLYKRRDGWILHTFRGSDEVMETISPYNEGDEVAQVLEASVKAHPDFPTYILEDPRDYSGYIMSVRVKGTMIGSAVDRHWRHATRIEGPLMLEPNTNQRD